MKNLALAVLDGYLTKNPETKQTKTDKTVTTFTIAVNNDWGDSDDKKTVSYIPIETWSRLAENCQAYLKKGRHVIVDGRLHQDRWEDERGKLQSKIKIVAQNVRFGPKPQSEGEEGRAA